ncbi:hypothetical protein J2793_007477 [Paraburkholderia caledonica]|uniref:Uncharacterized protein n=1 Tax=Paraburkholderia caledonica TaxID=134536 RepID=A0AB73IRM3_9BURK|nr:hypothetical protein [Paraburkholderia caledonica]
MIAKRVIDSAANKDYEAHLMYNMSLNKRCFLQHVVRGSK